MSTTARTHSPRTLRAGGASRRRRLRNALAFSRISAVYLLVALIVIYGLWVPDTFLTTITLKSLLAEQAIIAIIAVGLVFPLAAGVFDISFAWIVGAAAITSSILMADHHQSTAVAVAVPLVLGAGVGLVNGMLVVGARIEAIIATLGVSSCLTAYITWISQGRQIVGLNASFQELATGQFFGISYTVYYLAGVALIAWYLLEHTPGGRRLHATGGGREAARLSGVRTDVYIVSAFVVGGLLAGLAGMLTTARVGAGSPDIGPGYLLPVFAAVFLGATQCTPGRFNVWGTVIAVYVLAVGVKGVQLAGAPYWLPDLINGVALLLAVGLANMQRQRLRLRTRRNPLRAGEETTAGDHGLPHDRSS